jgi:hypothetical protein
MMFLKYLISLCPLSPRKWPRFDLFNCSQLMASGVLKINRSKFKTPEHKVWCMYNVMNNRFWVQEHEEREENFKIRCRRVAHIHTYLLLAPSYLCPHVSPSSFLRSLVGRRGFNLLRFAPVFNSLFALDLLTAMMMEALRAPETLVSL